MSISTSIPTATDSPMPSFTPDRCDASQSSPPQCGIAKNIALHKKKPGDGKRELTVSETVKRVVGENTSKFVTEVGILIRRLIPPTHSVWRDVPLDIIADIRHRLADEFNLDLQNQMHREVLDMQMMNTAKKFRYELRRYFLDNVAEHGYNEAKQLKHPRVELYEDWETLIHRWDSNDFKALSKQNSKSRAHIPYMHKGGSKSNANKLHEMLQEDSNATWVDVFQKQHSYAPDKWVSPLAEKQHAQMLEYMNPPSIPESEDGSETVESRPPPLSATEAMEKTLGSRSGYVRGMGRGPKPPPTSRASSTFQPSQSEMETKKKLDETIEAMEVMKDNLTQQEELTRTLQEQIARQATQLEQQPTQFTEQSAQFAQLMRMWQASQQGGGGGGGEGGGENAQRYSSRDA